MRAELTRVAAIEAHLLSAPAEWRLACLLDPELAADTAAQQAAYAGLRAAGRHQLRQELAALHAQLYGQAAPGPLARAWAGLRHRLRRP